MNLKDYQKFVSESAFYKDPLYPFDLFGIELHEMLDKENKAARGDYIIVRPSDDTTAIDTGQSVLESIEIIKEIGDQTWALTEILNTIGVNLEDIITDKVEVLPEGFSYRDCIQSLKTSALLINNSPVSIPVYVKSAWTELSELCIYYGYTMDKALKYNIEKVEGRKSRGTLEGNGDNR